MAKQLSYLPLNNLGLNGLNTQASPTSLDSSWLTKADNVAFRETGRVALRKGLKQKISKHSSGKPIGALIEHTYTDTTASPVVRHTKTLCAVNNKMYTVDFSSPGTAFTGEFTSSSTVTADDWQMVEFNNEVYCFQEKHVPVEYERGTWDTFVDSSHSHPTYGGISDMDDFTPSCGMGHYGRLWVGGVPKNRGVLYYSDTLDGHDWTTGTSGYLDLRTVWGEDEIVAIAPFYGKLVIFGKHNIAIYDNPWNVGTSYANAEIDASTMALSEVIRGIGCVSRDSVQAIGDDLVFLSATGLRSLARTSELDKVPLGDYSVNIKDLSLIHI